MCEHNQTRAYDSRIEEHSSSTTCILLGSRKWHVNIWPRGRSDELMSICNEQDFDGSVDSECTA